MKSNVLYGEMTLKMTCRKTLPKRDISEELDRQIKEGIKLSDLCKADVIRQTLRIGLPQFAARLQPPPLWLEERIREALVERAEPVTAAQFEKNLKAIARGACVGLADRSERRHPFAGSYWRTTTPQAKEVAFFIVNFRGSFKSEKMLIPL